VIKRAQQHIVSSAFENDIHYKNKMTSMLHSAFASVSSWLNDEAQDEGSYKFFCNDAQLIELILEKAQEKNDCVDVEQKTEEINTSPRHKKCPSPSLLKSSRILPHYEENVLTEKLLRERAQSGELGVRVGDGTLSLELIPEGTEGYGELLLLKVDDASAGTVRKLAEIPEYCSTILAICFDCSKEDIQKLEDAVRGPSFSWKLCPVLKKQGESEDEQTIPRALSDQDFEAFVAIARATVVLHVLQAAGF
jgi:hypothetical protein